MHPTTKIIILSILVLSFQYAYSQGNCPYLAVQGNKQHLVVDGKPFIVRGGELGNSSFTSVEYMKPHWATLKEMHLNTVLAPVYWELIEPKKGQFEFGLLDELIQEARNNDLKLILLWFGSWKNSMSSHVPAWIKTDQSIYPRAVDERGNSQEILTPFSQENLEADKRAFVALMNHLKEIDSKDQTVIMVQPENEIGMLPSARDYHDFANAAFSEEVPVELLTYLQANREDLVPEFKALWKRNGYKTEGNWEEVFGAGYQTDELFMAWHFAQYTEEITKAGKEAYGLPMFVNAALIRPGKIPGEYPSAGPLPHLMDIWRAGTPSIDFFSPDFYNPDFEYWNDLYTRQANTLFVPEHAFDGTVGAKALFTIGHYEGIGFSPFSIENGVSNQLKGAYSVLEQLEPLIGQKIGQNALEGVLLDGSKVMTTVVLGDYEFSFKNSYTLGWEAGASKEVWDSGGALILQVGPKEFYIAGSGVVATFKNWKNRSKTVGILKCEEGRLENGQWQIIRHLNGDQTHQGRHVRISHDQYSILRVQLYEYD
ncbi:GH35 family beta-galactosidase [Marinoscillum pacificum]|uniref:GH35 family beta-galactosidase n=1 Tax=Marinoscillum pacificum TaxID=392723 RepID=UPI0021578932|nr:DUF5597 domain-containing protein [Marinoscillum pacificum]